jgi:hypothetical protein
VTSYHHQHVHQFLNLTPGWWFPVLSLSHQWQSPLCNWLAGGSTSSPPYNFLIAFWEWHVHVSLWPTLEDYKECQWYDALDRPHRHTEKQLKSMQGHCQFWALGVYSWWQKQPNNKQWHA